MTRGYWIKFFLLSLSFLSLFSCSNFMGSFDIGISDHSQVQSRQIWINDGNAFCYDRTVTINQSVDNAVSMRFSDDNITWTDWETYAPSKSWTFAYLPGAKTVYGQFSVSGNADIVLSCSVDYIDKIYMNDGAQSDGFGSALAVSSDGMRIAAGIPNRTVSGAISAGAVAVCDWNGLSWTKTLLVPSTPCASAHFGYSLAMSPDGKWIAVGSPGYGVSGVSGCGHVYLFHYTGSAWSQSDLSIPSPSDGDELGSSIALYYASDTLIRLAAGAPMGSSGAGEVCFWSFNGTVWSLSQIVSGGSLSRYGSSVAFSTDGLVCAVGAPESAYGGSLYAGAVSVLSFSASSWTSIVTYYASDFHAEDRFGSSVALSQNGSSLCAGARLYGTPDYGKGYLLSVSGGTVAESAVFLPLLQSSDFQFGYAVAISNDAAELLIGAPRYQDTDGRLAGRVFDCTVSSSIQTPLSAADASGDFQFGYAVALSPSGSTIAVGAPGSSALSLPSSGAVYIIRR